MAVLSRLFISYARRDARILALRLQADLIRAGYEVWLDTAEIDGGASWSREIEAGIERCDCGLTLLSHGSFDSEICRAEQLRLLRKRKRVIPLLVQIDAERPLYLEALNYRDFSDEVQYAATFDLLKDDLAGMGNAIPPLAATPTNADPLPPDYIIREELMNTVRAAVLNDGAERRVALTALQGMGGIGKSVLASALCHDEAVRDAYPDGVIWLKIGQNPGTLVPHMRLIGRLLGDAEYHYASETEAESRLRTFLPGKSALIVLDDVWDVHHVLPFIVEARRCRVLFTTRDAGIAHDTRVDASILTIHGMKPAEAVNLLQKTTGIRAPELVEIAHEVGYHPLALSLAGGRIKSGMSPTDWLAAYHETHKIVARRGAKDRHESIEVCFDLSIIALDDADRKIYHTLGIFPNDVWIPRSTITRLWGTYGLSPYEASDLIALLVDLALVEEHPEDHALSLHDLLHDYNLNRLGVHASATHLRLVEAWGDPYTLPDKFAWMWYAYHLHSGGETTRLHSLLLDYRWLRAKLDLLDPNALLTDLSYFPEDNDISLVKSTITNSAHILSDDQRQFASQLTGRLLIYRDEHPRIAILLSAAAHDAILLPTTPSLQPTGSALLRTLTGHSREVTAVAYSPTTIRILSASVDGTVNVWDPVGGQKLLTLSGHTDGIYAAAYSPDGTRIVTASHDKTVRVWDAEGGQELLTLKGHLDTVTAAAYSPDGTRIVSASNDKSIRVWDAHTGQELLVVKGHTDWVTAAVFSRSGTRIASASFDKSVRVWDAKTGQELLIYSEYAREATAIAYSPDGTRLVTAFFDDETIAMLDAETGESISTLSGHIKEVTALGYSPDGRRIVSASYDETVGVWDAASGRLLHTLRGHTWAVRAVAFSPNGKRIASASDDTTVKIWDADNQLTLHDTVESGSLNAAAYSPDGTLIATASDDKAVRVWDALTGQPLLTCSGHTQSVYGIAYSPDGARIASASDDKTVRVWDARTGELLLTLEGHTNGINTVAYSPDGLRIVSASDDKTVRVWDALTGQPLLTCSGHVEWVLGAAYSPDGTRIVSAACDKTARIWDAQTGQPLLTLTGHVDRATTAQYSPDGTRIITASRDKTVRVWDAQTGKSIFVLSGHTDRVRAALYSPDATQIVSVSLDRTVRLWDAKTGECLARFDADAAIRCAAYSPDGRFIAAGDAGGKLHILWIKAVDEAMSGN